MSILDDAEKAARIASTVADLLLAIAPDDAQRHLDEAAVRRANAIADAAEIAKFGAGP